jgi:hypothetical protein
MPNGAGQQINQEIKPGDILLASTTVASLVIAVVALLPEHSSLINVNQVIASIGSLELSLGLALLFCGLCALTASIWAINGMRREANMPVSSLFVPRTNISVLFIALCLFTVIYLDVIFSLLPGGAQ